MSYYHSTHWRRLRRLAVLRDGGHCTAPGCTQIVAVVDHIITRPRGAEGPTAADRLDNLRSLCGPHDRQIKEMRSGLRRRGGRLVAIGCDCDGWPRGSIG